jgi:cation transport regulator ChaC
MDESRVLFFGYGSLITEPEQDRDICYRNFGILDGVARGFNKRSPRRGCPRSCATNAFPDPTGARFQHEDWTDSLAVGTLPAPGQSMVGLLVGYPSAHAEAVLARIDKREGYDAGHDRAKLGYLRTTVAIQPLDGGDAVQAWVYLSNPEGPYHVCDRISVHERARILINATPRPDAVPPAPERARGLYYMENLRRALREHGVIDGALERLAESVLSVSGPWCDWVHRPERRDKT